MQTGAINVHRVNAAGKEQVIHVFRAGESFAEATLATATALNPHIGYDRATEIVKVAVEQNRPLREVAREMGVSEEILEQALDHRRMARPHE